MGGPLWDYDDCFIVEFDGACRPNPGYGGCGALVRQYEGGDPLMEVGRSLGMTTNNRAEYQGLILGLQAARHLGARNILVKGDSQLVVSQITGQMNLKSEGLQPLYDHALDLMRRFDSVGVRHVPREENEHADDLANTALQHGDFREQMLYNMQ